ncbi:DUF4224 domain-containing protein [Cupriavidus oxalaticus]|uniref:DUF4224 domain-containing protein n=1 Tax=Cupriavidus oxalaticus TaxID=96344 RepID=A0A976BBW8_9BURK|nr:DUF4224 domain-containing protein [Cupriavidus oxalaticus]QRQ88488.1 DUF4224 domain-containing protein [Cupriavidus oxalaticus]QRQ93186.1 DUF4224 domain-containing protein [Cupriavidus oxalaticus]WQD81798.1 DUF4224 domain-containing protein [Cupriavidus oxalaticus]SPC13171.1 conserved hypothetical protein [Cupriavidus oxalaticus]
MLLTTEELRELTNRVRRHAQASVLNSLGVAHRIRPDGSIIVLRAHVEHLLGASTPVHRHEPEYEIDRSIM